MTLLAALEILLWRYSGESDIVVGSPVGQRERAETEEVVGLFVNTVAMRVKVAAGERFGSLLERVRRVALEAWAHQELPFEKLVEELEPERSLSHSPVFQVMLALQNAPIGEVKLGGVRGRAMESAGGTAKFDLLLAVEERGGAVEGVWEYSGDLFEEATVRRMGEHYAELLRSVARNAASEVGELEMMPAWEREQIISWNETEREYEREAGIWEQFREQARQQPDAVALEYGAERIGLRGTGEARGSNRGETACGGSKGGQCGAGGDGADAAADRVDSGSAAGGRSICTGGRWLSGRTDTADRGRE